jgi:glycosyltransferase involved in cell wall biosynthesis
MQDPFVTAETATVQAQARPRISVVMPCYNAAAHLAEAVGSVLGQDFHDLELIVVDDGSNDASPRILAELAGRDARLTAIHQDNAGAGPARNRALEAARGEWLAFLDADDWWSSDCLGKLLRAAEAARADLAYCGWQNVGASGGRGDPWLPPDHSAADLELLCFSGCPWPIHAVLLRRRIVMEAGGFDPSFSSCMDYDLWMRIARRVKVVRVPEVMAFYRHHGDTQITGNPLRIALNHLRVQENYLASQPEFTYRIGAQKLRELTLGRIREQAYVHYWARRLPVARALFRLLLERGELRWRDARYALLACLPETWLKALDRRKP